MLLKIKTSEIELEYSDEYSIIEEEAKRRILEIINQLYSHQINTDKPLRTVSAFEVFGDLKNE